MSRRTPTLATRLVSRAEACEALGICLRSFSTHWHAVFTDPRAVEQRGRRWRRRVYEDELAVAVAAGGGTSPRAKVAVIDYRGTLRRGD